MKKKTRMMMKKVRMMMMKVWRGMMKNESSIGEGEAEEERKFVVFRASIVAPAFPSTAKTTATTIAFVMLMKLLLSTSTM